MNNFFKKISIFIFLFVATTQYTLASIDIIGFKFTKTIESASKKYYVSLDQLHESPQSSAGSYDVRADLGFYGDTADMESDDFIDNVSDVVVVKLKKQGASAYLGELKVQNSMGAFSVMNYSGKISTKLFLSHAGVGYINPGKYTIDAILNNKVIDSFSFCLPTFTSFTGKSIGNETCGKPSSTNPPATTTQPATTTTVTPHTETATSSATITSTTATSTEATTSSETTTKVVVTNNTDNPTDSCSKEGCYETYSGLTEILGDKFKSFKEADDLSGFLNAIIGLVTGIAGVIAVAMIMYNGFLYMKTDNTSTKESTRSNIVNTVAGFVLLLSIYTLLRTINPDLLVLMPLVDSSTLNSIPDRSKDAVFQETLNELGGGNVPDTTNYSDELFIAYLYHQQGAGGAPSILWAAKQGYVTVPNTTPFIKGNASQVNKNMANNINKSDMQKLIGTSEITPSNFLRYWHKKVEAAKKSSLVVPAAISEKLQAVSSTTHVSLETLRAMCIIESRCRPPASDKCNSFGYCGLFQISKDVFKKYGVGTNIFDYYSNIYAGAKYSLYHKQLHKNHLSRIE